MTVGNPHNSPRFITICPAKLHTIVHFAAKAAGDIWLSKEEGIWGHRRDGLQVEGGQGVPREGVSQAIEVFNTVEMGNKKDYTGKELFQGDVR